MDIWPVFLSILLGIVQGIFEWLPISSEGNITLLLTVLGYTPDRAVQYALFLHLGTAGAAMAYFRTEIRSYLSLIPNLRSGVSTKHDEFWFLLVGTIVSGITGIAAYVLLIEFVTNVDGGILIVLIGILLVGTGLFQRLTDEEGKADEKPTSLIDAVLVGVGQGVAVLPGVSRSGTTVGLLLLREYDGPRSFRLSFLLSIPASIGAGILVLLDSNGGSVSILAGGTAILVSGLVGYASIDVLMRLVDRVSFWAICIALGTLAILGGVLILI